MRPLPRVLAFTDDRVAALDDFGIRAAAIAAVGSGVALVARLPMGNANALTALAQRCVALARPPEAAVLVTGRSDVAMVTGAQGVILRSRDLDATAVHNVFAHDAAQCWIVRSVHSVDEAEAAVGEGVDALILGSVWPTATHPDRAPLGVSVLHDVVSLGLPTFAIGGVTDARATEARGHGAWGVAAITALWDASDPYAAARALLAPWQSDEEGVAPCS